MPEKNKKKINIRYRLDLNEIKNVKINQISKLMHCTILKGFTKQETVSLNFLMIILQSYLRLNIKHIMEKESNY